ncbi:Hypothetical predicted protein [Pelobates cultripes]|uniref:Uncharacterized protein n=1 Tax=Pelobates cultripes TaxID=61616 RepID=A0AAD1R4P1_PELCU|nr:Hypothetical predicted protein [Pelobates cultripes]
MVPGNDPALLSISRGNVPVDPMDQTFCNIQYKISDALGPLLLILVKAEREGSSHSPSLPTLLASKMEHLKASSRAMLIIAQSCNYISNIHRTRWLRSAGMSDLAPKSHKFPNLVDSFLFSPSAMQEVKGRYKLKKSVPGCKKPFQTKGHSYMATE